MSNDLNFESAKLSGNECYAAQILGFHCKYFPWTSQTSWLLLVDILAAFLKNNSAPNGKEPEAKEEAGESHSWTFDIDACRRFDGLCFSFVLWN